MAEQARRIPVCKIPTGVNCDVTMFPINTSNQINDIMQFFRFPNGGLDHHSSFHLEIRSMHYHGQVNYPRATLGLSRQSIQLNCPEGQGQPQLDFSRIWHYGGNRGIDKVTKYCLFHSCPIMISRDSVAKTSISLPSSPKPPCVFPPRPASPFCQLSPTLLATTDPHLRLAKRSRLLCPVASVIEQEIPISCQRCCMCPCEARTEG